jgi:hypothetical protein
MITECNIKKVCGECTTALKKAKSGLDELKGMTVKSKADIDFSIRSDKRNADIFSFKKNFNKEYRLLPIIGVVLGILLIITLLGSSGTDKE